MPGEANLVSIISESLLQVEAKHEGNICIGHDP